MKYIKLKSGKIIDNTKGEYIVKEMLNRDNDRLMIVAKPEHIHENYVDVEDAFPFEEQADTIEELVDKYSISYDGGNYFDILDDCPIKTNIETGFYKSIGKENPIVYGGILTNKGLIYVARLKGVLPNGEIDWELL